MKEEIEGEVKDKKRKMMDVVNVMRVCMKDLKDNVSNTRTFLCIIFIHSLLYLTLLIIILFRDWFKMSWIGEFNSSGSNGVSLLKHMWWSNVGRFGLLKLQCVLIGMDVVAGKDYCLTEKSV